jgi:hypothetical protein
VAVGCGANEYACKKFREKMRDPKRRAAYPVIPVAQLWISGDACGGTCKSTIVFI